MFEPEELMARIVDLEEQLKVSEMAPPAAEQRIACLEGEIAKRDETIARLEPQLNRAIQANYDLREELAACRVAVENCELFRARIVELEEKSSAADDADFNLLGLLKRGAFALGLDPENTSWFEVIGGLEQLRAELSALKAQDPVAWVGTIEDGVPLLVVEPQNWKATPLYAAPVSEAKAQGVVMPRQDGSDAQIAFWAGFEFAVCGLHNGNIRAAWNDFKGSEQFKRLNAAPIQQVSVPDVSAVARILADRNADACNVNREDNWMIYGQDYIDDVTAMLYAAPAAPAADAGIVDMYRHLQKVTPYRFKKIQDASITDGGDVMYFHKDRFDAALLADMAAHCAANGVV